MESESSEKGDHILDERLSRGAGERQPSTQWWYQGGNERRINRALLFYRHSVERPDPSLGQRNVGGERGEQPLGVQCVVCVTTSSWNRSRKFLATLVFVDEIVVNNRLVRFCGRMSEILKRFG